MSIGPATACCRRATRAGLDHPRQLRRGIAEKESDVENRFDELTKTIARGASRREVLRCVVGLMAGVVFAPLGLGAKLARAESPADLHCCPRERTCKSANGFFCCPDGFVCRDGQCICPTSTTTCRSTSGRPICCPHGTVCLNGACCQEARVCKVPGTKRAFCCPEGMVCQHGKCVCQEGTTACTVPGSNRAICCPHGTTCIAGRCCGSNQVCKSSTGLFCCPEGMVCHDGKCVCANGAAPCVGPAGTPPICCPNGATCLGGHCCPKERICGSSTSPNQFCCPEGTVCRDGRCVCANGAAPCVGPNGESVCCPTGSVCAGGRCCPQNQACLDPTGKGFCCPDGMVCKGGRCVCPSPTIPCISPTGVPFCCPPGTVCLASTGS